MQSLTEKNRAAIEPSNIFVTSDQHLDHTNIIKYCKRPFRTTEEMNDTLIDNWNRTVKKSDTVYLVGDLAFGRGSRNTDYWLNQLNGNIVFIKGNHDKSKNITFHDYYILEYQGTNFYLTHDPSNVPKKWKEWAISGHHHNNKPVEYPYIDKENRRVNISVELTNYTPICIDEILHQINNKNHK
jgi:calcineurin-like phosphoesterase family protein